jgi:hypothetical protein
MVMWIKKLSIEGHADRGRGGERGTDQRDQQAGAKQR